MTMELVRRAAALLELAREIKPLVHQITNYVTVNDCANITLAAGASPIMADDIRESADITAVSSALVINIGTLNERSVPSMLAAGRMANALKIPIVFDPVGAGASRLRNETVKTILGELKIAVLRGNLSEISFVAGLKAAARGVDTAPADADYSTVRVAEKASRLYGCVTAVTGAVDIMTNGKQTVAVSNGHAMLAKVTGTGCMTSALTGVYCGVTADHLAAAVCAVASMGIAGEEAFKKAGALGTGSFRTALLDAISLLDQKAFEARVKLNDV